jgi:hypothetical protein
LYLDQGREQHIVGKREEAQTHSRAMMNVHLHKSEGYLPSRTLQKILQLPGERARMIRTDMYAPSPRASSTWEEALPKDFMSKK